MPSEAQARIKINKLLEAAGWRFVADGARPANIQLEARVTIATSELDALGDNFERTEHGFIDFLLLNDRGFPFIVLEAKSEDKDPLEGKEQARKYARSQNCRLVLLSNGNLHYLWDLERGNPYVITAFPTPGSAVHYEKVIPEPKRLIDEVIGADYIALTQRPTYASDAGWKNEAERREYIKSNKLRFLRGYQQRAVHALQRAVKDGMDRFLFEMATGTGKTLIAAAVIKLFLRTGNASRVLFLVDRLELEEQARKNFVNYLKNDFQTVVYKENRAARERTKSARTTRHKSSKIDVLGCCSNVSRTGVSMRQMSSTFWVFLAYTTIRRPERSDTSSSACARQQRLSTTKNSCSSSTPCARGFELTSKDLIRTLGQAGDLGERESPSGDRPENREKDLAIQA